MSSPFDLDRAVEALRIEHDDPPGDDADVTRFRIRESLDRARVVRSRLIATLVVCGVLSTGGVSWAYLSGRLEGVWPWLVNVVGGQRVVEQDKREQDPREGNAARVAALAPKTVLAPVQLENVAIEPPPAAPLPELDAVRDLPAPPVAVAKTPPASSSATPARPSRPRLVASPADRTAARPLMAPAPDPLLAAKPATPTIAATPSSSVEPSLAAAPDLYRAAHQLHFHGSDPAASLAAWDKYLASESSGRFAVEARYNRAMALIRLRRYREAHIALDPFARGEVSPAGYRQREAQQLSQRLERALFGDKPAPSPAPQPEKPAP